VQLTPTAKAHDSVSHISAKKCERGVVFGGFKTPNEIVVVLVDNGIFLFLPSPLFAFQLGKEWQLLPSQILPLYLWGRRCSVGVMSVRVTS